MHLLVPRGHESVAGHTTGDNAGSERFATTSDCTSELTFIVYEQFHRQSVSSGDAHRDANPIVPCVRGPSIHDCLPPRRIMTECLMLMCHFHNTRSVSDNARASSVYP